MKTNEREPKTKAKTKAPPFPEMCGSFFTRNKGHNQGRVYILLWSVEGWEVCHAWAGIKGLDVREKGALKRHCGYVDNNVLNADNYYWREILNTKAKTPEALINAVEAIGFDFIP